MNDKIQITHILQELGWKPAPKWRRELAGLLDFFISLWLGLYVEVPVMKTYERYFPPRSGLEGFELAVQAIIFVLILLVTWLVVFVIYEGLLTWVFGTSVGGFLFGLHITDVVGRRPSVGASFHRAIRLPFAASIFPGTGEDHSDWLKYVLYMRERTGTEVVMR